DRSCPPDASPWPTPCSISGTRTRTANTTTAAFAIAAISSPTLKGTIACRPSFRRNTPGARGISTSRCRRRESASSRRSFISATSPATAATASTARTWRCACPAKAPAREGATSSPTSDLDDEVEPSLAGAFAGHAHLQVRAVEAVAAVAGLVAEIKLRREDALSRRLHLDVDMPRAPGVFRRNDGLQAIVPLSVGELMAAIAKAAVVVFAVLVRVPEIEQGVGHALASGGQDLSRHDQPRGLGLRLQQGNPERCVGLEKRPFGLPRGQLAAG